ncbi:hypothetical protein CDD82_4739 [Ophiocordyceps australis]|uniref:Cytochrome b5 heme-binding domain-containing protein n=1 Tax=Ophiocordyceps australis TaxID=1399860 RepID=A0A2C5Z589_9HYPO|nr:hypothetical protein CDD82_4739 [Ophiocordyceps australis]
MGVLGLSLLFASVAFYFHRHPAYRPTVLLQWIGLGSLVPDSARPQEKSGHDETSSSSHSPGDTTTISLQTPSPPTSSHGPDSPTTPKASAVDAPSPEPVPTLQLSDPADRQQAAPTPGPASMMPPPPLPLASKSSKPSPQPYAIPTLPQFPAANSVQRASAAPRGPIPNRIPLSSGLVPPSTRSTPPERPSRKITLKPGRSPLDWARISGPNADLRGLPPETPYLRIPPSLLQKHNGRKGADAWMVLNSRVYNVSPYADYHPGGIPELMRGAGRDGTKLFGDIHPWVNYESMLSACMVGLFVDEPLNGDAINEMDEMD